ncbi:serine hydroxymethyltransferase [Oceanibaculum pacificum]|uniref:Serine hydroxymethyltransferase-like domain-containing protein n=1 Tax=Oceanibaculum pacificum TaxID=580166 RepID=A0A154W8A0_9PROT|nr:serine hydroxymethyltransferase [Oceanibaculum pacificum]KZD09747.1 hypothetical protein AUP43_06770 [Oceanibaculum pacificum]
MSVATPWSADFAADLTTADPRIQRLIAAEETRNNGTVNLIASESYCPKATVEAEASILVNKNATGYPAERNVAGCQVINEIEELACARALALFGAEHANIQALSSTIANIAVLRGLLKQGDTILSLRESAGGHHSHGARYHVSGQDYKVVGFGVDEAVGAIDLEAVLKKARAERPAMIVAGSTAYPRAIDFKGLRRIADEVGALFFADIAHVAGLVVTGLHENPAPYADVVTTSTHKTFCGPRTGGLILSRKAHAAAVDDALFPGMQGAPGAHIIAGRAVLFDIVSRPGFKALMTRVLENAQHLAKAVLDTGIPLYLGGTDTHMVVADLRKLDVSEVALDRVLEEHNILCNRITLPIRDGDASRVGLRLGSNAMTIRGMDAEGLATAAQAIASIVRRPDRALDAGLAKRMRALGDAYPVPLGFLPQQAAAA